MGVSKHYITNICEGKFTLWYYATLHNKLLKQQIVLYTRFFQARVIRHHHRQPRKRIAEPVWQMVGGIVRGEGSLCKVYMEAGIPSWGGGPLLWLLKASRDWSAQVPDNHNLISAGLPLSWTRWLGWSRVNYLQLTQGNQFSNWADWSGMVFHLPIIVQLFKIFPN